jgi:hypothetical protein
MLSRWRNLGGSWALLAGLLLAVLLGIAVETSFGGADQGAAPVTPDKRGRRLYVLVIDSFSVADAEQVPAYKDLVRRGLSAQVEPCLERITYMCIRDALTGRTNFSLFGLFQNWGVAARDPGANLLRDARAAGRSVAMVSAGDLAPFHRDTDKHRVFHDRWTPLELEAALDYVDQGTDLVIHHSIWHDVAAHHDAVGTAPYRASLRWVDTLIAGVVRGLPADMDLLIAGDHGHSDDGRHVQGQDIPTVMALVSPRIAPQRISERIPISALRFLAGASLGLPSSSAERAPQWADWLAPTGAESSRELAASSHSEAPMGWPVGVALVALGFAAVVAADAGWTAALLALVVGASMGLGFPWLLGAYHFPGDLPRLLNVLWVPSTIVGGGALLWRRTWGAPLHALAVWGAVALVALYPVMAHYGLVKNLHNAVLPVLIACALANATVAVVPWRRVAWLGLGGLAVTGWVLLDDFGVFNVEITDYRFVSYLPTAPWARALCFAGLAAGLQWALDEPGRPDGRRVLRLALAATLGSGLVPLPGPLGLLPLLGLLVALAARDPALRRWMWIALVAAAPMLFNDGRQLGLLATLCLGVVGIMLVAPGRALRPDRRTAAAVVLVGTGYLGMAWAFGLSITGVDYTFTLRWLPGQWHERLWWLVGIATTVKCVVVPLALGALARVWLGDELVPVLRRATSLLLLRATLVAAFAAAWMAWAGPSSGGIRLAVVVQEVLYALLIGISLHIGAGRGPRPAAMIAQPAPDGGPAVAIAGGTL